MGCGASSTNTVDDSNSKNANGTQKNAAAVTKNENGQHNSNNNNNNKSSATTTAAATPVTANNGGGGGRTDTANAVQPATIQSSTSGVTEKIVFNSGTFARKNPERFHDIYEIKKGGHLGSGSFASVFLATHKQTKLQRAVKACALMDPSEMKNLRQEIEIMKELSHPNVITVIEYFVENNKWLFVLELCEGGELFDRIVKKKHFTESESAEVLTQVLHAVAYCHSLNIAHRDIKPENLLYESQDTDSRLRLSDFGYACKYEPGEVLTEQCGSPYYVAPEVLKSAYTEKCDIWSVGVILYILLVGHVPFDGKDNDDILNKVEAGKVPYIDSEWAIVSKEARDLCTKLLAFDPKDRPAALDALQHPWFSAVTQQAPAPLPESVIERMAKFRGQQLLQRAVNTYVALNVMSAKKKDELAKAFTALDKDGDGTLDMKEIMSGFAQIGEAEKLASKFAALDCNRDGKIDYGEFVVAMMDEETAMAETNLRAAFRLFDADGNGVITAAELKAALGQQNVNSNHTETTWHNIIKSVDSNGDGVIDFEEFKKMMSGAMGEGVISTNIANR